MEDVYRYIEEHLPATLEELRRLVEQPSVSAQNVGIQETASLVVQMLREHGFETRLLNGHKGNFPVVYGELRGASPKTLLFYNHYDVQPPEPLELWTTPPFKLAAYDEYVRARGVSDNKGDIVARLAAIKAIKATRGELPVSIKFFIEGDEEVGSPHLEEFTREHGPLFQADACLWEGGEVNWGGQPVIQLGLKGIMCLDLDVETADRDAHSSMATVVPNAIWRLVWALSTLKDREENILVEGFYDSVAAPTAEETAALDAIPPEEDKLRESMGLKAFLQNLSGREFWRRHYLAPTINVCGIIGGYTGEGSKTVLPHLAKAKLDVRLVPNIEPEDIAAKIRRHLDRHGFSDVKLTLMEGEKAARTPMSSPWVRVMREAARDVYGLEPVVIPNMAGSGPMYCFTDILGLPVATSGVGYPECRMHAPDENIRLADFVKGTKMVAAVIDRFARS